ncbi:MAG: sensor histidine kinase, partial [Gammaproteobacteria bacterium]
PIPFTLALASANAPNQLVSRAWSEGAGFGEAFDERGRHVLGAYQRLGPLGLVAVLKVDAQEIYAPAARSFGMALLLMLLLAGAGAMLVQLRVRPLASALEDRVRERTAAFEAAQARYRALVETTPAIIYSADLDDEIKMLYISPYVETLLGFTPEAWLQDPERWIQQLHPEDRERILDAFGRSYREGTPLAEEYRLLSRAGEVRWFQDHAVIISDPQSHRRIMYGTVADITARKETEQAARQTEEDMRRMSEVLRRSNEDLREFAYAASHDLKEPVRGIHNYAQFLLEDYGERLEVEGQGRLQAIMRLTERMEGLIDALLQASHIGRVELALGETDLNGVLAEVLDSLAPTLAERRVEARLPSGMPVVRCDRMRIGQVFHNLIGNAVKYNDKESKWVEIGWRDEAGESIFYVRDNGIGIPEKHWEAIFRIFKRLHGRDVYGGGSGVGLAIVKKIIERHGGRIWVESQPGAGSTFYFSLQEQTKHS